MKRLILLIALVVLVMVLAGLSSPVACDTGALPTDSNILDNILDNKESPAKLKRAILRQVPR